jgi:hypothetical protein
MSALTILSLVLLVRGLSMDLPGMEPGTSAVQAAAEAAPVLALTTLDVNDQTLRLRYKITNRSDHDIWVCEGVDTTGKPDPNGSEVYLDDDARSLVIAKRIEAPMQVYYVRPPDIEGRYVCLAPGQERIQSLALAIPVKPRTLFTARGPDIEYATRLLVKIGAYDEYPPGGRGAEEVAVPYRWTAYLSGKERCMEIAIDGVFIEVGR